MAAIPIHASDGLTSIRFNPLSTPYLYARSALTVRNSSSAAIIRADPKNSALGWGRGSCSGMTGSCSSTGRSTVPLPSATGVTIFIAAHRPEAREMAAACIPNSRHSRVLPG